MLPYYILFIVGIIGLLLDFSSTKNYLNFCWRLIYICALFLFVIFRYEVGTDYVTYVQYFDNTSTLFNLTYRDFLLVEPGYVILSSIIKSLGLPFEVLSAICIIFVLVNFHKVFLFFTNRSDASLFLYFSLFFLSFNLNLVRHGVMVSFIWCGFIYLIQGKKTQFITYICLGALFHGVSLFFLILFFFLKKQYDLYLYCIVFCISLLISLNAETVFTTMAPFIAKIFGVDSRVIYYLNGGAEGKIIAYGYTFGLFINFVIFLYSYWRMDGEINKCLTNILFIGIISILIFNSFPAIAERIASACYVSVIFIIPNLLSRLKLKSNLAILLIVVGFYAFSKFNTELTKLNEYGEGRYFPYKSILSR